MTMSLTTTAAVNYDGAPLALDASWEAHLRLGRDENGDYELVVGQAPQGCMPHRADTIAVHTMPGPVVFDLEALEAFAKHVAEIHAEDYNERQLHDDERPFNARFWDEMDGFALIDEARTEAYEALDRVETWSGVSVEDLRDDLRILREAGMGDQVDMSDLGGEPLPDDLDGEANVWALDMLGGLLVGEDADEITTLDEWRDARGNEVEDDTPYAVVNYDGGPINRLVVVGLAGC